MCVDIRRSDQLKGQGGSPSFGKVGSLDQAHAGIHPGRLQGGHVRGGGDPRKPGLVVPHGAVPTAHGNHRQIAGNPEGGVEHFCQLAHSHSVPVGYGILADKRPPVFSNQVSLHIHAVNRIWTVADDHPHPGFPANFHAISQGVDEGVIAGSHVLDIEYQVIEIGEVLWMGA